MLDCGLRNALGALSEPRMDGGSTVSDRWFAKAAREPGHPAAHGYPGEAEPLPKAGLVYHSAEGGLFAMRRIIQAPGSPSWTFSNPKTGKLIQHYERGTNIWANGSKMANVAFDACESEGMAGEPLTESQTQNLITLARWYMEEEGWLGFRRHVEAWEHNEMTRFGAAPTACPSDRIPWEIIIPALEDDMAATDAEILAVLALYNEAAEYARLGLPLKPETKAALKWLLGG